MDNSLSIVHSTEVLGKSFQIYGTKDAPLFLAKDVAEWIEHSNHRAMLNSVDDDEKLKQAYPVNNPYGGYQIEEQWFLTEHGLYEVLMQSRKPIAKEFKRQVKRILTEIRQTGSYGMEQKVDAMLAMFASTITVMQQSIAAMQQSVVALQSRSVSLSLPGDNLPEKILRSIRIFGGVATREQILHEVGCAEDEFLLSIKDLLVSNRICETRHWSLTNGGNGISYCLPDYGSVKSPLTAPVRTRKFTNSRIPCALRHSVTGEVKYFCSMREALRFLNIPTYGVSYPLALTIKKDNWEFIEIKR